MHAHLVKECQARGPGFTFSITLPTGSYDTIKVTALREFLTCPVGEQLMQYPAIQAPPTAAAGLFLDDGISDAEELEASASAGAIVPRQPELAEQAALRRVWFRVMSVKKHRIMHGGPGVVNLALRELNGQMELMIEICRLEEFGRRTQRDPAVLQKTAEKLEMIRNFKQMATVFGFMDHPEIVPLWRTRRPKQTEQWEPAVCEVFYRCDMHSKHSDLKAGQLQTTGKQKRVVGAGPGQSRKE